MQYSREVEEMVCVMKGPNHGPAPIPEEGKWIQAKEIKDISGYTHGVGWCAPQQGACKLSLNVKNGVIQEALVETIGCSGMTHSAAMASEILPGKTILEALNTDLVCDAINTAMRELFLQIVYGRTQSAFSDDGLVIGAGMEDLGKEMPPEIVDAIVARIQGYGYTWFYDEDLIHNVLTRYDIYCGQGDVKCFINVGGNDASFGDSSVMVHTDGGILTQLSEKDNSTGLVQLFLKNGIPVIHLLNIKSLAAEYGLPIDPVPLPAVGQGGVYYQTHYETWIAAAGFSAAAVLLWLGREQKKKGTV